VDNDCDAATDEDFEVALLDGSTAEGVGAHCGVGACEGGVTVCDAAGTGVTCPSEAAASGELCDGDDNDCDGLVDAADPSMAVVACARQAGVCAGSERPPALCVGGAWTPCTTATYVAHDGRYEAASERS